MGTYKSKTITGASYFLTIVDDFSRLTWTFLLSDKTQVFLTPSNFFAYVSNQFQTCVKVIRTDNGSEFVNHNCQKLFSSLGIVHQRTIPYSPQQNGKVERKHLHFLQIARALLSQANLPIHLWGHAILMATHIINILPTKLLTWDTPFERLYNKPPYTNLKVFGCLCFATNTIPHKPKFESRATMCCLIGFNSGQKAYKLYDLNEKNILMSRDVIFYENLFPCKGVQDSLTGEKLVIPNVIYDDQCSFETAAEQFIPSTHNKKRMKMMLYMQILMFKVVRMQLE